jgi:membrane protease YdiL (CAAX protease family)
MRLSPVFCPTIFSPLKLMEGLFRRNQLGGTSMTAQETTIRHDPQAPPADSTAKRIFIGPNGLRAGWRLLIFMAIVKAMSTVAQMIISRFFPAALDPTQMTPMRIIAPDLLFCFVLAIAAWTMSKIEGRRLGQYGLPKRDSLRKNFWVGLLIGLLATSSTLLAIFALHGVRFTSGAIHGTAILTAAACWGLAFLLSGLAEEFLFRGYAQFTLAWDSGLPHFCSPVYSGWFTPPMAEKPFWEICRWFRSVCCCACSSAGLEIYGVPSAFTWDMTGVKRSCTVFQIAACYPPKIFSTHRLVGHAG